MAPRSQFKIRDPEMTVRRLSVYTRSLQQLEEDGVKTDSSQELAERFSLNSAQGLKASPARRVRGAGHRLLRLRPEGGAAAASGGSTAVAGGARGAWAISASPSSTTRDSPGRASGSPRSSTRIPSKWGKAGGRRLPQSSRWRISPRKAKARNLQFAIVAVPGESAQVVTEKLVAAGIKTILNFAPGRIKAGQGRPPQERGPGHRAGDALVLSRAGQPLRAR